MTYYDKLVRDKIPEKIEKNGEIAITRTLNDDEFKLYLEKKLLEEVKEVIDGSKENKLEELADLYEVIITYARIYKINLEDIINQAKEKNNLRGSFNKKILLIETKK